MPRAVDLRIDDPLRQPQHRRRPVPLLPAQLVRDLAQVRAEDRFADDRRRPGLFLLGRVVAMAGEAAALDEQLAAVLRIGLVLAGDVGEDGRLAERDPMFDLGQLPLLLGVKLALGEQSRPQAQVFAGCLRAVVVLVRLLDGSQVAVAELEEVVGDRLDLGVRKLGLVDHLRIAFVRLFQDGLVVVRGAVEVRHLGVGPELARRGSTSPSIRDSTSRRADRGLAPPSACCLAWSRDRRRRGPVRRPSGPRTAGSTRGGTSGPTDLPLRRPAISWQPKQPLSRTRL